MLDKGYRGGATPSRNRPHSNLMTLRVAVIILFALLTAKLVDMQLIHGNAYAQRSRENHIIATNILPSRGLILARDGTPLVQNVGVYTATITPQFLPQSSDTRYQTYLKLEKILNVPALQISQMVSQAESDGQGFLELPIKKYLSKDEAIMLDEASTDMPGVALSVTPGRQYLGGLAFSSILGYVGPQTPEEYSKLKQSGYRINEPIGKTGLESSYESDLRGSVGVNQVEQDAQGDLIQQLQSRDATPGDSIKLSIDPGLQNYVSDLLQGSLGEVTEDAFDAIFDTNVKGLYFLTQRAVPEMVRQGRGKVINIASQAAAVAFPKSSVYCASKAAVVGLTKALAVELGPQKINVNAIGPSNVETPINAHLMREPAYERWLIDNTPYGRNGRPEDIAPAAVYLASDESDYVTGITLYVDGGWIAR